jgi:HAE1 family hydrophobic/amphiphilic exporter-1
MTLTIVSVFLPIAFTTGAIGRFYREFGITVTAAVLISLFEAFTLAPMLSAHLFKKQEPKSGHEREEKSATLGWMDRTYRRVLGWTLAHMKTTAIAGVIILSLVIFIAPMMELSFLPRLDNANFQVGLQMPPGTTLAVTDAQARQVEAALLTVSGVDNVFTSVGGGSASERASFNVQMKDLNSLKSVEAQVRQKLAGIKGLGFNFQGGFGGGGTNVGNRPIQINLLSPGSPEELDQAAITVINAMEGIPGLADIDRSNEPGKPELRIDVDRSKAALYGLSTSSMGATIRALVSAIRRRATVKLARADIVGDSAPKTAHGSTTFFPLRFNRPPDNSSSAQCGDDQEHDGSIGNYSPESTDPNHRWCEHGGSFPGPGSERYAPAPHAGETVS